jgi:hypothetical protein
MFSFPPVNQTQLDWREALVHLVDLGENFLRLLRVASLERFWSNSSGA